MIVPTHHTAPSLGPTGSGRIVARCAGAGAGAEGGAERADSARTVLTEAYASSPLRLVCPNFPSRAAGVCLVTLGAGLVDGDNIEIDVDVGPGATLLAFTQASTKVFRGASRQSIRARVAGTFVLLPDPVSAFRDEFYTQRIDVELTTPEASCVLLDGFTSGRAGYGERWAMRGLDLRTTVRRREREVVVDALRLDHRIADHTASYEAFLTLFGIGPRAPLAAIAAPASPPTSALAIAAGPLLRDHGAVARFAATSPAGALAAARARLRNLPDIDVVDPFAHRY